MFKVKFNDMNSGLKLYKNEVAKEIKIYGGMHRFIPVLAHEMGYKVKEVDIIHHVRKYGVSKFKSTKVFTVNAPRDSPIIAQEFHTPYPARCRAHCVTSRPFTMANNCQYIAISPSALADSIAAAISSNCSVVTVSPLCVLIYNVKVARRERVPDNLVSFGRVVHVDIAVTVYFVVRIRE